MLHAFIVSTTHQGLHDITGQVADAVAVAARHGSLEQDGSGLCTVFVQHTSASLIIQENADPSAKRDLEAWLNRLVAENDPLYTHNDEGPDDMPAHVKAALTATSIAIPIERGRLALGTWQGIYLWEHRRRPHQRRIVVHMGA
jgi:secondary thiamine-phosphate synthase enzyme